MKNTRQAQQIVEYLLVFGAVVLVILGVSGIVGDKTSGILKDTFNELSQDEIYTYAWIAGDCGPCSLECGGGEQTCDYICERNDGMIVDDTLCADQGAKPPARTVACNTQPCPIHCVWGDWPDCTQDPMPENCGTCEPACGNDRKRVEKRDIVVQGAYGGNPCIPEEGLREVSCEDLSCSGICQDNTHDLLSYPPEQCDGNQWNYDGKIFNLSEINCTHPKIQQFGGHQFNKGRVFCSFDCKIDLSECEYTECGEPLFNGEYPPDACEGACTYTGENDKCNCPPNRSCTKNDDPSFDKSNRAGKCALEYQPMTKPCWQMKMNDFKDGGATKVNESDWKEYPCVKQSGCQFNCDSIDSKYAQWCHPWSQVGADRLNTPVKYHDHESVPDSVNYCPAAATDNPDLVDSNNQSNEPEPCSAECQPPVTLADLSQGSIRPCKCPDGVDSANNTTIPFVYTDINTLLDNDEYGCCCPETDITTPENKEKSITTITHIYTCDQASPLQICGNGQIEDNEECDINVFKYEQSATNDNSCANYAYKTGQDAFLMSHHFDTEYDDVVDGVITCDPNDCKIVTDQCVIKDCNNIIKHGCGINGVIPDGGGTCADGERLLEGTCILKYASGEEIGQSFTGAGCVDDPTCDFSCQDEGSLDARATWCQDYDKRLTLDNQPTAYVAHGNCPNSPAAACVAECNNVANLTFSNGACDCEQHYTWNGSSCDADDRNTDCSGLPHGAEWTMGTFQQTWNGSSWEPASVTATYNTSPGSDAECTYECQQNYEWSGNSCDANTQTESCIGLPANAKWNTKGGFFIQTWDGSDWVPNSVTATYNTSPGSDDECTYECKSGFTWNDPNCE